MQEHRNWLPSLSLYHVKVKYDVRRRTREKERKSRLVIYYVFKTDVTWSNDAKNIASL